MKDLGFADDQNLPSVPFHIVLVAVGDVLKREGWFEQRSTLVPQSLAEALRQRVARFLHVWAERSEKVDGDWDALAEALALSVDPHRFIIDPRNELRALFCRLAGIGARGRSFDQAAEAAGLNLQDRTDSDLRDIASWMRGMDREHLSDRDLPGKSGLLFERIVHWPFIEGQRPANVDDSSFRQDLVRYRELTNLDIAEVCRVVGSQASNGAAGQPHHLGTWMQVFGLSVAAEWFASRLRHPSQISVRDAALLEAEQVREGMCGWLCMSGHQLTGYAQAGVAFQDVAASVFAVLVEHSFDLCEIEPAFRLYRFRSNSAAGLRAWFARAAYEGREDRMPAEVAANWLRLVKQELASFRPLFAREEALAKGAEATAKEMWTRHYPGKPLGPNGTLWSSHRREMAAFVPDDSLYLPSEVFERDREHFLACAEQIFLLEGLWEGMHQLLLAMRALKSPCVASDLRYWEEPGVAAAHYPRQPEEPWRCIPAKLVASFHAHVTREESRDPELKALRGQFAAFCLHGLRDKWSDGQRVEAEARGRLRTNEDMVESSPTWRYCRIRAAKALAINPEGRGHRLLQTSSEIDPDPDVREVANDAYQSLRRSVALPDGISPRRAILGAFWWLRQAHLKALKIEIDRDGAQRTRIKELSRTKERQSY
jgi:hypothetical protein